MRWAYYATGWAGGFCVGWGVGRNMLRRWFLREVKKVRQLVVTEVRDV